MNVSIAATEPALEILRAKSATTIVRDAGSDYNPGDAANATEQFRERVLQETLQ